MGKGQPDGSQLQPAGSQAVDDPAGASLAAALLVTNPNLLYLQSTPMTEPLLLGLLALGLMWMAEGVMAGSPRLEVYGVIALTLACLTRYESWPATVLAFLAYVIAAARSGRRPTLVAARAARLALIPLVVLAWFLIHSKVTVGAWFVTGGFYVPDPMYRHHPMTVSGAVWWGLRSLGSPTVAWGGVAAGIALGSLWFRRRVPQATVIAFAFAGVAALPWYAFYQGHPFRVRYMVPLVAASAVAIGLALGTVRRGRVAIAILVLLGVWWRAPPFDSHAAMVEEAQWDRPKSLARRAVTACLPRPGGRDIVMASMGSLAHYMQELAAQGFELRDFLHEGNGDLWLAALDHPRDYVRWILIEEVAEGGDMLAERSRTTPHFLDGFTRRCEGGGVALYSKSD